MIFNVFKYQLDQSQFVRQDFCSAACRLIASSLSWLFSPFLFLYSVDIERNALVGSPPNGNDAARLLVCPSFLFSWPVSRKEMKAIPYGCHYYWSTSKGPRPSLTTFV